MRNHLTRQLFMRNLRHLAYRWLVFLEKFANFLQMVTKTQTPSNGDRLRDGGNSMFGNYGGEEESKPLSHELRTFSLSLNEDMVSAIRVEKAHFKNYYSFLFFLG